MDNFLIAKATDVGVARQINEDSMTVFDSPNGRVMVVCDGMGGQAAGDVASQMAINIIENILTDNTFATPEEAIRSSVMAANQGVLNHAARNPETQGMGSTCVMLIVKDGRVHCGWVGDSRIYYISNHTIRQISHDQSYVQQLVDSGQISAAEAENHPQKNEITNCIGLQGMLPPVTMPVPIVPEPGSVFLLCSDGLTGMVDDARIERTISNEGLSLQERAEHLVNLANQAGGLDNITIELIQFDAAGAAVSSSNEANTIANVGSKSNKSLSTILSVFLLLLVCGGGAYYFFGNDSSDKAKEETSKPKTERTVRRANTTTQNHNNSGKSAESVPPTPTQSQETRKTEMVKFNKLGGKSKTGGGKKEIIKNPSTPSPNESVNLDDKNS